jgi:hypothetical protein
LGIDILTVFRYIREPEEDDVRHLRRLWIQRPGS